MSQYWLIAVPNVPPKDEKTTRARLFDRTQKLNLSTNFVCKLPESSGGGKLKVGTMDQLMQLSDELGKIDTYVEGVVKKIERTCIEVVRTETREAKERAERDGPASTTDGSSTGSTVTSPTGAQSPASQAVSGQAVSGSVTSRDPKLIAKEKALAPPTVDLKVERISKDKTSFLKPEAALEDFMWDFRRYQTSRGIAPLSDQIFKMSSKSDEDLKIRMAEFSEIKQSLSSIERKEGGSLLVRALDPYVRQKDIVESEYLTTLLLVVPRIKEQEFLSTYEYFEAEAIKREKEKEAERQRKQAEDEKSKQAKLEEMKKKPGRNGETQEKRTRDCSASQAGR